MRIDKEQLLKGRNVMTGLGPLEGVAVGGGHVVFLNVCYVQYQPISPYQLCGLFFLFISNTCFNAQCGVS